MSERDEIQLRHFKNLWQSRQEFAGVITLLLGFLTLGVCLFFLSAPEYNLAGVMGFLLVLLALSCWRLLSSAARVVEITTLLAPTGRRPEFVEVEVVQSLQQRA